jgi:hypothetical protein
MDRGQMLAISGVCNVTTDLTLRRSQWFYDDSGYLLKNRFVHARVV